MQSVSRCRRSAAALACQVKPVAIARNPGDLLRQIQTAKPLADCTVAAWRFLGVSLAGWNVVIATVLAAVALVAASRPRETA